MNELPNIVDKSMFRMKVWYRTFVHLQKHGPYIRHNLTSSHTCLHCNNTYTGNYCPVCGQKHDVQRFTWSNVFQNVFTGLFNLGEGFLRTLLDLLYRPGYMIRDYLAGHRKPYFKPFQLLFVLSAILLICLQLTMPYNATLLKEYINSDYNSKEITEAINQSAIPEDQKDMIDQLSADFDKVTQLFSRIKVHPTIKHLIEITTDWISGNIAASILVLLPFWYFATKRSFRKTEYGKQMNGPERILSIVYIGGQLILLLFLMVLYFLIFNSTPLFFWIIMTFYWFFDHYQLYQVSFLRSLRLTLFMTFRIWLYLFIFAIIMGTITMQLALIFAK